MKKSTSVSKNGLVVYVFCVDHWGEKKYYHTDESKLVIDGKPPQEKDIFAHLLEEYLQDQECSTSLPNKHTPWTFSKGKSLQDVKKGNGTIIVSLSADNKDSLWELYTWVNHGSTCFRIIADY